MLKNLFFAIFILGTMILVTSCDKDRVGNLSTDYVEFHGKKFPIKNKSTEFSVSMNYYGNNPKEAMGVHISDAIPTSYTDVEDFHFQIYILFETNKAGNGPVQGEYIVHDPFLSSYEITAEKFNAFTGILSSDYITIINPNAMNNKSRKFPDNYEYTSFKTGGMAYLEYNSKNQKVITFDLVTNNDINIKGHVTID